MTSQQDSFHLDWTTASVEAKSFMYCGWSSSRTSILEIRLRNLWRWPFRKNCISQNSSYWAVVTLTLMEHSYNTSVVHLWISADNDIANTFVKCGNVYIDEKIFNRCAVDIKIDVGKLGNHLLTHDLVANRKELDDILNPHHSACEQLNHLLRHVSSAGGKHGYFLLYVSLFESAEKDNHQGHKDAVEELKQTGTIS